MFPTDGLTGHGRAEAVAERLKLPYPILLLVFGLRFAFVPALTRLDISWSCHRCCSRRPVVRPCVNS